MLNIIIKSIIWIFDICVNFKIIWYNILLLKI